MSDVIERLLEALNRHDVDGAAAVFAVDYRSVQPAHPGREFVGRAQMHANWTAMFAGVPDFHAEVLRSVDDGRTTWSEWHWSGTHADGQPFAARGVTLFEIVGTTIVAGRLYVDEVVPEPGGIEGGVARLSGERPRRAGSASVTRAAGP